MLSKAGSLNARLFQLTTKSPRAAVPTLCNAISRQPRRTSQSSTPSRKPVFSFPVTSNLTPQSWKPSRNQPRRLSISTTRSSNSPLVCNQYSLASNRATSSTLSNASTVRETFINTFNFKIKIVHQKSNIIISFCFITNTTGLSSPITSLVSNKQPIQKLQSLLIKRRNQTLTTASTPLTSETTSSSSIIQSSASSSERAQSLT